MTQTPDQTTVTRNVVARVWAHLNRATKIIVAFLGVAGLVFGILASVRTIWPAPDARTAITAYLPSPSLATSAPDLNPVSLTCAQSSFASLRRDAHLCIWGGSGGIIHDPCFEVSADLMSCPAIRPTDGVMAAGDHVYDVYETVPFFFDDGRQAPTVGVDSALEQDLPWAVKLDTRVDGEDVVCFLKLSDPATYDHGKYICGLGGAYGVMTPLDSDGYISGENTEYIDMRTRSDLDGLGLDRSTDLWTIRLTQGGSSQYSTVAVLEAWF